MKISIVKTDAEKKETKHSSVLLLRLVSFFLHQSLCNNKIWVSIDLVSFLN